MLKDKTVNSSVFPFFIAWVNWTAHSSVSIDLKWKYASKTIINSVSDNCLALVGTKKKTKQKSHSNTCWPESVSFHYPDNTEQVLKSLYAHVPRCKTPLQRCFLMNTVPQPPQCHAWIKISKTLTGRLEGEQSGIEMSDQGGVSGSILQGIYSCADVCLSGVDSELLSMGGDSQVVYDSCRVGRYWWWPAGIGRREVCE